MNKQWNTHMYDLIFSGNRKYVEPLPHGNYIGCSKHLIFKLRFSLISALEERAFLNKSYPHNINRGYA